MSSPATDVIGERPLAERPWVPISDYGAIGNLRTTALVSRGGSIDWLCQPELDDSSVFAALLDRVRGGRFVVELPAGETEEAGYLPRTNILRRTARSTGGVLETVDFLPLSGDLVELGACGVPPELHRQLRCLSGEVEVRVDFAPRPDYARLDPFIHPTPEGCVVAWHGAEALALAGAPGGEVREAPDGRPSYVATLTLRAGERANLVMASAIGKDPGRPVRDIAQEVALPAAGEERRRQTEAAWRGWLAGDQHRNDREWAGPWAGLLERSELALKLLTHRDTGAIAAAATTSLPEEIGGIRNWDYRASWIRDAGMTVQSLVNLGHLPEAEHFLEWAERSAMGGEGAEPRMQIMYGLHGERDLPEEELGHLSGWRDSAPVRIGNGAADQWQPDILGEIWGAAHELCRAKAGFEGQHTDFLVRVADRAAETWTEPDHGIWEQRGPMRHYVHSKAMTWVALERAAMYASEGRLTDEAAARRWASAARAVKQLTLERGVDDAGGLKQAFDRPVADAANLLVAIEEMLEPDHPIHLATIDRVERELTADHLVYRYRADDGLPGEEGAFGLCSFWRVDALALAERVDEAGEAFEALARRAGPLGLYSEQIDPHTGDFLGNYPQAFTHIGLINSLLYLAWAEGRLPDGMPALVGTPEHRAEMAATRT